MGLKLNPVETQNTESEINEPNEEVNGNRYPALRTIASFFQLLAILVGFLVVGILYYFANSRGDANIILLVSALVIGVIIVLFLLATSESIKVFLDIEYNTRKTAEKQ